MFAVVKTGGKQYKVAKGDVITVEKIDGEVGSEIELGDVLMAGEGEEVQIGSPALDGKKVIGKILAQDKGPKVIILKHLRRKNSRKKQGHRQLQTRVEIVSID